jgi:peptidoglycan/xylan/chitin deacetylase (PgdA/CDA1 family)
MSWTALDAELSRWRDAGRVATLWWRDDDAVAATPALDAMLRFAGRHGVPAALAVVPAGLERSLVDALAEVPQASVLQHGYAHRNHAPPPERSRELGGRAVEEVERELAAGAATLRTAFGPRFLPVVVPPWNRIDAAVVARLPALGCRGLSTFASRPARFAAPGLLQCNAHVDPIAWRDERRFVGAERCTAMLVAHLADRREGRADPGEPTGLLTHHLVFTPEAWDFVASLFARTAGRPGVQWLGADAIFDSAVATFAPAA